MNPTVADPTPPGDVLAKLTGVGKDYPVFASRTSRLKTIARILLGRETDHYHRALNGIDLTIRRGESWGVIGENGAGKSTMLKLIAGVSLASRGQCEVRGRTAALLELGAGFHPEYSGRENVFLAAALMGWSQADTAARMDDILAFADIGEAIEQPLKTYSTGMAVRLGFALVTATRPELLVTDEVLAVGDESFQKKCLRWMERYLADGGSLVFCSHSMYHVQSLCQKALWLHHGECREVGEAFEVTHHYLAWHEAKLAASDGAPRAAATDTHVARMLSLRTTRADGTPAEAFELGEDIVLEGTYHSPDDRSTIVMSGIARIDGTPIYGTLSSDAGFESERLGPQRFGFRFVLPGQPLLPGKYRFKTHTLDNQGLRMFDTLEVEATVSGKTRDHGLVRLEHHWQPLGRPGP